MTDSMIPFYNAFKSCFDQVKKKTGNDARRINFIADNNASFHMLVEWMVEADFAFEQYRSSRLYLENVPSWFVNVLDEYQKKFKEDIDLHYIITGPSHLDKKNFEPSFDLIPSTLEIFEYFDIGSGDGTNLIDHAMRDVYELGEEDIIAHQPGACEAWCFFRHIARIDFEGIEHRWKKLPTRLLLTLKLQKAASSQKYSTLTGLLEAALNSYLFGSTTASLAICRTLCETVLRDYYLYEWAEKYRVGHRSKHNPSLQQLSQEFQKNKKYWRNFGEGIMLIRQNGDALMHRPYELDLNKLSETDLPIMLDTIAKLLTDKNVTGDIIS